MTDPQCSPRAAGRSAAGLPAVLALLAIGVAGAASLAAQGAPSTDWPQWRGPGRDGMSAERGLLQQWPSSGPTKVFTAKGIGGGYGTVAVAGSRLFVQGLVGQNSTATALDKATGAQIWVKTIGAARNNDQGPGPRGTPTVDGDRLYVLTENGDLACLRVADGTAVWQRNILKEFGARNIPWLISESPLVDGSLVIVSPGGRGAGMAALDKLTGRTVWTSKELNDEAGYGSPIVADIQGVRTVMTLTSEAGVGVRASDGKLMWRYTKAANNTANIATPVFSDDKVFYTSNYGTGAALLALTAKSGEVVATERYFTSDMQNHHGGVVLVDGYLYGFSNSILTCLEFSTGKTMWRHRSVGKGSLIYADGRLYILSEGHVMGLADASPKGYVERGRFPIDDQGWPSWAHPVVADGRLYVRNQGILTSYDVRTR
jgi:outer membrane protein assembly factor BamB